MKNRDRTALDAVAVNAQSLAEATERREQEAAEWLASRLDPYRMALEEAVFQARDEGHSVIDIARAFTTSGRTPNRNAIYAILSSRDTTRGTPLPFEWVPRTVKTVKGKRTVFDVQADLEEFGPDNVSGEYTWRYDTSNSELDPVLTAQNPYPYDTSFYKSVLDRWLTNNPYPGEE
jgi:hypothetical protein